MQEPIRIVCLLFGFGLMFQISGTNGDRLELFPNFLPTCAYRDRDFILLGKALSSGLNFFGENIKNLVLDAAVGTRILERQLGLILESNHTLTPKIQKLLMKLIDTSTRISESIVVIVNERKAKNPKDRLKTINTLPWITLQELWKTPKLHSWKELLRENLISSFKFETFDNTLDEMNEEISDKCIGELFKTCQVSSNCQKVFLEKPASKYSLTHQVLFLYIAKQMGCTERIDFPTMDWEQYFQTLCLKVLEEAEGIEKHGFPSKYQDLFTEQVTVCSIAGYRDFIRPSWMYEIVLWQKQLTTTTACFLDHDDQEEVNKLLQRSKRSDALVEYDSTKCSIHFSAVGMAALAIHMRYFLEVCVLLTDVI